MDTTISSLQLLPIFAAVVVPSQLPSQLYGGGSGWEGVTPGTTYHFTSSQRGKLRSLVTLQSSISKFCRFFWNSRNAIRWFLKYLLVNNCWAFPYSSASGRLRSFRAWILLCSCDTHRPALSARWLCCENFSHGQITRSVQIDFYNFLLSNTFYQWTYKP